MRFGFRLLCAAFPAIVTILSGTGCQSTYREEYPDGTTKKEGTLDLLGQQEGLWKYYYQNGELWIEASYEDDNPEGPWSYWFENGQMEMQGRFSHERRRGPWRYWQKNGKPRAMGSFIRGTESGPWSFWSEDGTLERRGCFYRGKPTLRWTYWYPQGGKKAEGWLLEGKRVGLWRFWDESGRAAEKEYPVPPEYELVQELWPDGTPRREGFQKNGTPDGLWVTWHKNGLPRLAGAYLDGSPGGEWIAWRDDGGPLAQGEISYGRPVKEWRIWTNDVEGTWQASGGLLPPGIHGQEWSDASIATARPPEAVLEVWLSEVSSPVEADSILVQRATGAPAPSAREERALGSTPVAPVGTAVFTKTEEENVEKLVDLYSNEAKRRASGASGSTYSGITAGSNGDTSKGAELIGKPVPIKSFHTADGRDIQLDDYKGKKNVLLVILRGYTDGVCIYCATQTRALSPYLDDFANLDTEVLCVYPGTEAGIDAFKDIYRRTFQAPPPYSLLYDTDNELARKLDIEADLAMPTSLLIDKTGKIYYAYVGTGIADRPPAEKLLEKARELQGAGAT